MAQLYQAITEITELMMHYQFSFGNSVNCLAENAGAFSALPARGSSNTDNNKEGSCQDGFIG
jgi:hypothetical protein